MKMSSKDRDTIARFISKQFPDGTLTAIELLEKARPTSSPVHKFFQWDDSLAAENYRLSQARQLIRIVVIDVDGTEYRKYCSPVYIEELEEHRYVELEQARRTPDLWSQVLERALKDAELWRMRYEKLREVRPIVKAIANVERKVNRGKGKKDK